MVSTPLRRIASLLILLVVAGICLAGPKDQQKNQKEEKLKDYYKKWLEQDVVYIITPDEKSVFEKLTTDQERDQFIEQFWRRRDPDPKTPFNEYKQEHYRRITYANEHFTAGIPGWKTDRGMVYIKFGPPTNIEDYEYGAGYDRPYWEGGGHTKVFPTQFWRYRFIDGIGQDVELEFVDKGGGNLYTLTTNKWDKDLLLHATVTSGNTWSELNGDAWQIDRVTDRREAGDPKGDIFKEREKDRPFAKYELLAQISKAPEIKYKDLKSIVNTRIKYDLFPFQVRVDYIKISEKQVLVPVTLQVPNSEITFEDKKFGMSRGTVNFYGMVTTLSGQFVQEFEDDIVRDVKTDDLRDARRDKSRYQKLLLLPSGLYKLGLVVKDVSSGRVGVMDVRLQVPTFNKDQLNGSSLILASAIQKVDSNPNELAQFVLGDLKVIPDFQNAFQYQDPLWIYLQVYNVAIDQNRLEPNVEVEYIAERNGKPYYKYQDLQGSTFRFVSGDRVVITGKLPLKKFEPGSYTLRIRVHDNISGKMLEKVSNFEVVS